MRSGKQAPQRKGFFGGAARDAWGGPLKTAGFQGTSRGSSTPGATNLPSLGDLCALLHGLAIVGPKILGTATTKLFEGSCQDCGNCGVDFGAIAGILLYSGAHLSTPVSETQGLIMTVLNRIPTGCDGISMQRYTALLITTVLPWAICFPDHQRCGCDQQSLNRASPQIIHAAATLGILVMMLSISWQMTLIAQRPAAFARCSRFHCQKVAKHFVNQQEYLGAVNGLAAENYSCHNIVKASA